MLNRMPTARETLAQNLRDMMAAHERFTNRKALAAATGISPRSIGYMLQSGPGNPTLANIEAVAQAFKVPAWQLLVDSPAMRRLAQVANILDAPAVPDSRIPPAFDARNHAPTRAIAATPPPQEYLPKPRTPKPKK